MSYQNIETPYSVNAAPLMPGLGTAFDRSAFTKAIQLWHELDRAANDLKYPRRFDAVRAVLKKHGLEPSDELADKVFEQMLEHDRAVLAGHVWTKNREIFEAAVTDRFHALRRKLADKLRDEGERIETSEREAAR